MTKPSHEHEFKEDIKVDVWYPDHDKRTESELFKQSRHNIINVKNTPCFVCGSHDKLELHHFIIEWAYSDAIDWEKMKIDFPDFDWANFKNPEDFIDSEYNMLVLCEKHHRGKDEGIHMLPYPIWRVQKYLKDGFVFNQL